MITIEVPTDWLNNPNDGHRHRQYFENLCAAASKITQNIELVPINFGTDFNPRESRRDNLLLSFHSVGEKGNVLRIKEAAVFPFYCFEDRGHSGWSELATNERLQSQARQYGDIDSLAYLDHFSTKYRQDRTSKYPQKTGNQVGKKDYVLYLMQIAQDPVAHFARMTQYDIIDNLIAMSDRNGVNLVIKRHPFCPDTLVQSHLQRAVENSKHAEVSDDNVIDLIEGARSVVTVNSGSGFESLLLGKAHYSIGSSEWDAISHQVHIPSDLERAFSPDQRQLPNTRNYLAYMLSEYWVDITNVDGIVERLTRKIQELDQHADEQPQLLKVEMTREEFCRYLVMNNRHNRFQQIVDENQLLRRKIRRTLGGVIRKALQKQRWYEL